MSRISVVGIGAGNKQDLSLRALSVLCAADLIVGYSTYIDLLKENLMPELENKEFIGSAMTTEVQRCKNVLTYALSGKNVALVSSGDSGAYGMAGLMLDLYLAQQAEQQGVEIEIIPGISAFLLASARLGAPMMHDFVVISLSDLLTPRDLIIKRLQHAIAGDFVLCLYNPASKTRSDLYTKVQRMFLAENKPDLPVGIVRNAGRTDESVYITTIEKMDSIPVDMFCTIIIGNSTTKLAGGFMLTPRGYSI